MTRVLVLDFDGTMTDAEREGEPFIRGYLDDLATLTGAREQAPRARLDAIAAMIDAAMLAAPAEHGYPWNGRLVAPASVDPYLRMVPVANAILDEFKAFEHAVDRARLHQILFRYNYDKTRAHPCFKSGARELLASLAGTETFVVTNSDTEAVRGKIETLDDGTGALAWLFDRVHGYAQKFEVDDTWADGPAELRIPELQRAVPAASLSRSHPGPARRRRRVVEGPHRRRRHLRARPVDAAGEGCAGRVGRERADAVVRAEVRRVVASPGQTHRRSTRDSRVRVRALTRRGAPATLRA